MAYEGGSVHGGGLLTTTVPFKAFAIKGGGVVVGVGGTGFTPATADSVVGIAFARSGEGTCETPGPR